MKPILTFLCLLISLNAQANSWWKTPYSTSMDSVEKFNSFAIEPPGFVRTGQAVKFVIDNRGYPRSPKIYYVNGTFCGSKDCTKGLPKFQKYHVYFAGRYLKSRYNNMQFRDVAYYPETTKGKKFIGGRIQTFELSGPGGIETVYGVCFLERDGIREETIQFAMEQVQKSFSIPSANLAVVTYSETQTVKTITPWLEKNEIRHFTVEDVMTSAPYIPLNLGEASGTIRFAPKDSMDLKRTDIPVFTEIPIDLAVVAGTITTAFQGTGSHVNLKAMERGTPNFVVRDADAIAKLKALDGQTVRLVVNRDKYTIERITRADLLKASKANVDIPWKKAGYVPTNRILEFGSICKSPTKCLRQQSRYGSKVAGLSFLGNSDIIGVGSKIQKADPKITSPDGLGLPLKFYIDFMKYNVARNKTLADAINGLYELESKDQVSRMRRQNLSAIIRKEIMRSPFPNDKYRTLGRALKKYAASYKKRTGQPLNKLKIRSSANVEDIPNFNGAGLHNSFSADLSNRDFVKQDEICLWDTSKPNKLKVSPRSLSCAIKGVYASLWNYRAIEERSYRRFDHKSAAMGAVIQPDYKSDDVVANGVVLTRILGASEVFGYQVMAQVGNSLVTNPVPGTKAELSLATFQLDSSFSTTIVQKAHPRPGKGPVDSVLPEEIRKRLITAARHIEQKYCESDKWYNEGKGCKYITVTQSKPYALDMEFKVFRSGEILFKQVRSFSGR